MDIRSQLKSFLSGVSAGAPKDPQFQVEEEIADRLIAIALEQLGRAGAVYLQRLNNIMLSSGLTAANDVLARLKTFRIQLLAESENASLWLLAAKTVNPEGPFILPQRFIKKTESSFIEISKEDLETAEFLRSDKAPKLV